MLWKKPLRHCPNFKMDRRSERFRQWQLDNERVNQPIAVATVAASLLGSVEFTEAQGDQALERAYWLLERSVQAKLVRTRAKEPEPRKQFVALIKRSMRIVSWPAFVKRITRGIPKIQYRARERWVRRLWPMLDWEGEMPWDLNDPSVRNFECADIFASELVSLYRDRVRQAKQRPLKKKARKAA
jgi:hypothetical protein